MKARPPPERPPRRQRQQLVISLGSGIEGVRRRAAIVAAVGSQTLSHWALDVLLRAAGENDRPAMRSELGEMKARLDEMAMQVNKLFRLVTGRDP